MMEQPAETNPGLHSPESEQRGPKHPLLYSPGDVAVASLIGSHFAGCIVMAINYRRMGRRAAAWWTIVIGLIGLVAVVAVSFHLPVKVGKAAVALGLVFAMLQLAKQLQGKQYEQAHEGLKRKASTFSAAAIGVLCLGVVFGVAMAVVVVEDRMLLGRTVQVAPGGEVYCGEGVSDQEAVKLAKELKIFGLDCMEATIKFSRERGRLRISYVAQEGAWNDYEVLVFLRTTAAFVSEELNDRNPVDFELWDEDGVTRKTVLWDESYRKLLEEEPENKKEAEGSDPKG